MRQYKKIIGFASLVLVLFLLGFLIRDGVIRYKAAETIDNQTTADAQSVATHLNDYVSGNAYIPYTLSATYYPVPAPGEAPHSIPPTISYTKLNYTSYQFCVSYQTGIIFTRVTPDSHKLVIPSSHGRGQNCQVIHPSVDPIQLSGSLRVCDQLVNRESSGDTENAGYISVITKPTASKRLISLGHVTRGSIGPFTVSSKDKIYDASCNAIPASSLKVGQPLYIFQADDGNHLLLQENLTWH